MGSEMCIRDSADDVDGVPSDGDAAAAAADIDGVPLDGAPRADGTGVGAAAGAALGSRAELAAMPLPQLVALCEESRVSSSGSRAEMADRLLRHVARRERRAAESGGER